MFERAEVSQPRPAVIKNLFAPLQCSEKIAGQQFLQDQAPDTVVKEAVITAIKRPKPAQKARIIRDNNEDRQRDYEGGHDRPPWSDSHQNQNQGSSSSQQQHSTPKDGQTDGQWRGQMHGKRARFDPGTEYPFPDIVGLHPSASLVRHRSERLVLAFPHDRAAPTELAVYILRRQ